MSSRFPPLAFGFLAALWLAASTHVAGAVSVPPQFVVESAVPGVHFILPTAVAFLPDGRMLVCEKRGRVWSVDGGVRHPEALWDGETEVLGGVDCGLLSVAVDPAYTSNHYIYLLYTVDPDSNGIDIDDGAFGRLTRYTVSFTDSNTVDPDSRTILLGVDWANGPLVASGMHTIGDLQWGADGSLLVSAGDGANVYTADAGGLDNHVFEPGRTSPVENIGAFRSQYIGSLAGKILRINPADGRGYPSNPFWNGNGASVQSRVWCYGLRNPFRFVVRPDTGSPDAAAGDPGTLIIGDVGWYSWEELDIATQGGRNFGWPCHEGPEPSVAYQAADPIHHGCDSLGLGDNTGPLTGPAVVYHHADPGLGFPPGFYGNCVVPGVFYTATKYPAIFRGRCFFADYGTGWIRFAELDASNNILSVTGFASDADGPADLALDPTTGDLVYVAIVAEEVRRIRWTGPSSGNNAPVTVANATPLSGVAPLVVDFTSTGTFDPDLDPLTLSWNFGDGVGAPVANAGHVYLTGGVYAAVLTADDGRGGITRDTAVVTVYGGAGPMPNTPLRDDFNRPNGSIDGAWAGEITGAIIRNQAAGATCCDIYPVWDGGVFGPDQEAFLTFATVQLQPQGLLLKVQGSDWTSGCLLVNYHGAADLLLVSTYTPGQGFFGRGEFPESFVAGDQLGVRAWSNGSVELFKNGVLFGTASIADWKHVGSDGRIGFFLDANQLSRIDDFGGGNVVFNTAPTAEILAPSDSAFFVVGEVVPLWGRARDFEQAASTLSYGWRIDLHHNNHVHPSTFTATGVNASYPIEDHDDGTGVWYRVALHVTDSLGLADTSWVSIFPEVDLRLGLVQVNPFFPGTTMPAQYRFPIANDGRMAAPMSRWRMVVDGGVLLAEGEVQVPALDTVEVVIMLPPLLSPGDHTLRVVVDTLAAVVETQEDNNAVSQPLTVVVGPGVTGSPGSGPPGTLVLSRAYPSPSAGPVSLALELPRPARVAFTVHDLQGRRVWSTSERDYEAGRWVLHWDGRRESGADVAAGLYHARVTVDGQSFVRPIARMR